MFLAFQQLGDHICRILSESCQTSLLLALVQLI